MRYLVVLMPPLLIYGSWWLYGQRVKQCKRVWKQMEGVASRNTKILTGRDVPESAEPESLAVYATGHEW